MIKESKEEAKLTVKFRNDLMKLSTKYMRAGGSPVTVQLAMLDIVMEGACTMHEEGLLEGSDLEGENFNELCTDFMSFFVDQWCEANKEEVEEADSKHKDELWKN